MKFVGIYPLGFVDGEDLLGDDRQHLVVVVGGVGLG